MRAGNPMTPAEKNQAMTIVFWVVLAVLAILSLLGIGGSGGSGQYDYHF